MSSKAKGWILAILSGVVLVLCGVMVFSDASTDVSGAGVVSSLTPQTQPAPKQKVSVRPDSIREGVWSVGEDVKAGRYRTTEALREGQNCYWSISTDPEGQDIVANDIPTGGRPTVTLKKGQWFKSEGCGDWVKS